MIWLFLAYIVGAIALLSVRLARLGWKDGSSGTDEIKGDDLGEIIVLSVGWPFVLAYEAFLAPYYISRRGAQRLHREPQGWENPPHRG